MINTDRKDKSWIFTPQGIASSIIGLGIIGAIFCGTIGSVFERSSLINVNCASEIGPFSGQKQFSGVEDGRAREIMPKVMVGYSKVKNPVDGFYWGIIPLFESDININLPKKSDFESRIVNSTTFALIGKTVDLTTTLLNMGNGKMSFDVVARCVNK
jgi:hypothetical protein